MSAAPLPALRSGISWSGVILMPLARFAVAQVKDGRRVGARLNCDDVSSQYCRQRKGIIMQRLDHFDEEENAWAELVVEDRHATPADLARVRIDFASWLKTLPRRMQRIAQLLAVGHRAAEVACRFHLSRARISQLRGELHRSWQVFMEECPIAA
jgi:hypothetical protein